MNEKQTTELLYTFREYWPTFQLNADDGSLPGTIRAWASALEKYSHEDVSRALMQFRVEQDRKFAPTVSEFAGRLEEFEAERTTAIQARRLLSMVSNDGGDIEYYTEQKAVGKKKNGDDILYNFTYCRMNKVARLAMHDAMIAKGFYREDIPLAGGKMGYRYCKGFP